MSRSQAALAEHPPFPAFTCVRPSVYRPEAAWGATRTTRRTTEWWNPALHDRRRSGAAVRRVRGPYTP